MEDLCVDENQRKPGIGQSLFEEAPKELRRIGVLMSWNLWYGRLTLLPYILRENGHDTAKLHYGKKTITSKDEHNVASQLSL